MAVYEYKALEKSGKTVRGIVDADSEVAARQKLREQNLYPTKLRSGGGGTTAGGGPEGGGVGFAFGGASPRDLALMTRQLAVLLVAGMPLSDALNALIEQTSKARLRKTIYEVRARVTEGTSLADAFQAHRRIFSELYVNMVRAGESSGTLEAVLGRLADILERQAKLRARVLSTLAYPSFMVVFAIGIISFLTFVIVPRITQLFERQEQELPRLTEILIGTTGFVGKYWWAIMIVVAAAAVGWRLWVGSEKGRLTWDRMKLRFPLYGPLHLKLVCGRFSRVLGTMLQSGLTMMRALNVVSTVVENKYIEATLESVKSEVRRGGGLARPLRATGLFPPLLIHMTELGERSGELEKMLVHVADTFDEDVQVTVDAVVSLLEPMIIVVMGVFVGLLVLSILLPILNLTSGVG
jgi:general secretion pathway protein F